MELCSGWLIPGSCNLVGMHGEGYGKLYSIQYIDQGDYNLFRFIEQFDLSVILG